MKLPNGQQALIDPLKVTHYSLDPEHDEGRHKAHLFESVLGINRTNADVLLDAVEEAAATGDAILGKLDKYGQRYVIDFTLVVLAALRSLGRLGSFARARISLG